MVEGEGGYRTTGQVAAVFRVSPKNDESDRRRPRGQGRSGAWRQGSTSAAWPRAPGSPGVACGRLVRGRLAGRGVGRSLICRSGASLRTAYDARDARAADWNADARSGPCRLIARQRATRPAPDQLWPLPAAPSTVRPGPRAMTGPASQPHRADCRRASAHPGRRNRH